MESKKRSVEPATRCLKGTSLIGPEAGPPSLVETDGEKIIRIRPFPYDWKYEAKKLNPGNFPPEAKPSPHR